MIDLDTLRKAKGYVLAIVDESTGEYKPVSSDVVQVIRCKDCKWAVKCYGDVVMVDQYGEEIHEPLGMNGYCSMAEREDNETD